MMFSSSIAVKGHGFTLPVKLILFMSLIIVVACSSLSWYFVTQEISTQTLSLINLGHILSENLAHHGRYRVFTKDQPALQRLIVEAFSVKEVVYIRFAHSSGQVLAAQSKGRLHDALSLTRSVSHPLFPDNMPTEHVVANTPPSPLVTTFRVNEKTQEPVSTTPDIGELILPTFFSQASEVVYDFAVPILRTPPSEIFPSSLAFELQPDKQAAASHIPSSSVVYGVVQLGLSNAFLQHNLREHIQHILIITLIIIVGGILCTIFLAHRLTGPLKALTGIATQITKGNLSVTLPPRTHDEIGTLTDAFNQMTMSLQERHSEVQRQIQHLDTLNQVGTLLTSSFTLTSLLPSVLRILIDQSPFHRAVVGLYDHQRRMVFSIFSAGFGDELNQSSKELDWPVEVNSGVLATGLLKGEIIVNRDLATLTHPSDETLLKTGSSAWCGLFYPTSLAQ